MTLSVEEVQAEANDALGIISRQRNMAAHEAAMQETRALKAERALEVANRRVAELERQLSLRAIDQPMNGKAIDPCLSPPS